MTRDNIITGKSTGFGLARCLKDPRNRPATDAEMRHSVQFQPGSVAPAAERITGKPIPLSVRHMLPADGLAEVKFHPTRKWRFDFAWPQHRVALEIEGGAWSRGRHTRGRGFIADLEKYNEAACRGWIVIRTTPQHLETGQAGAWVARVIGLRKRNVTQRGKES